MPKMSMLRSSVSHRALIAGLAVVVLGGFGSQAFAKTEARTTDAESRLLDHVDMSLAQAATPTAPASSTQPSTEPTELPVLDIEGMHPDENIQLRQAPIRRIPTTVQDTPQTISVITKERMQEQNLINLRDVMLRTPGITMHAGEGGGSQPPGDSFNLRGFTTQNDIFVNGIRDIGIANRDTFNLESVEIFKGPSGSFFGRGSGGGSINMTTKRARLGETFGLVNGGIGTSDYYRVTGDVNAPITDNLAFRLNTVGMMRDYAGRDHTNDKRIGFAPTLTLGLDTDTNVILSYSYQKDDNFADNGVPWYKGKPVTEFGVDRSNFYGYTDNFEKTTAHRLSGTVEHKFTDSLRLSNTLQAAWYEIDRWNMTGPVGADSLTSLFPDGFTATSAFPTASGSHQSRGQESWAVQNQTTLGTEFQTWSLRHELTTSIDLAWEEYDTQRYTMASLSGGAVAGPPLNVLHPELTASGLYREKARRDKTTAKTAAISLYDRVEFAPGWFVLGNVRYERYMADSTFTNPDGSQAQPDGSTRQNLFTYMGGLQYKPMENQTYYVSYGVSQLPQYDAGLGYGEISGRNDRRDPQQTRSIEVGGKISLLENRLGLGVAVFRLERDNEQTYAGEEIVTHDYKKIVNGVELQVDGRVTERWSLSVGYAFLDSKVDRSGHETDGGILSKTPKHSGFFWTGYDITPRLTISGGAHFVSKRYGSDGGDKTDGNHVPWQWQLDASARYRVTDAVSVQLNGINLTDELTYDRIHTARQAHPGIGRTIVLNTTVAF